MTQRFLSSSLFIIILVGCADFDSEWRDEEFIGRRFNHLVVVGLSHELENRALYEETAIAELSNYGVDAGSGLTIFPQVITEKTDNADTITKLIIANNVDAVLIVKILHEDDHAYLMPEEHKRFKVFYGRWGRSKSLHMSSKYYDRPEKYYMISTLYDLHEKHEENEETVVWRASSLITNPQFKMDKKKEFIKRSIAHLVDQNLIQ